MKRRSYVILVVGAAWLIPMTLARGQATVAAPASTAAEMTQEAQRFLAALRPEQRQQCRFSFGSDERMNWHYIPRPRRGLPLKAMDAAQRQLAHAFLSTGLSHRGYIKATTIMSLEAVLRVLEAGKGPRRDADNYSVSVFGEPSMRDSWGWRVEGHHLSLNFTVVDGRPIAWTPSFFGANPAEVRTGPRKGLRVLAREEDLGYQLLHSLREDQRKAAILNVSAPADIITKAEHQPKIGAPEGLPASKLDRKQLEILINLISEYANNMPPEIGMQAMAAVQHGGIGKIYFAWAGGEPGTGHYYRVQGPAFLIEFDNTQNHANHIHSVWRDLRGDFGVDLLRQHYRTSHQP